MKRGGKYENDTERRRIDLCMENDLVIGNTKFI